MNVLEIKKFIESIFEAGKLTHIQGEYEFVIESNKEIKRIGYATNLSPETVNSAIQNNVDLIITHHDVSDFVYGMKEYCLKLLKSNSISHCFIHMPLDDCDFGTNVSFLNKLGAKVIKKSHFKENTFYCGRIGEIEKPLKFEEFVSKVENILGEKVKAWKNNDQEIKRIGLAVGACYATDNIKESVEENCDVYITGEKMLYTLQYAEFTGINLIVGSHTYTEFFGVESLSKKIHEKFPEIEAVILTERHLE